MKIEKIAKQPSDSGFDFDALVFMHLLVLGVKGGTRETISRLLSITKQKESAVQAFSLRKRPGGEYQSESLDEVLSGWLDAGLCVMDEQDSFSLTLLGVKELPNLLVVEFLKNGERFKRIAGDADFNLHWAMVALSAQFSGRP